MQMNSITNALASSPDILDSGVASQLSSGSQKTPFSDLFQNAMESVHQLEDKASTVVQGLLDGSGVDVHTAMIATSDADAAFELALAVRNKAVAAFQQIMGLQF